MRTNAPRWLSNSGFSMLELIIVMAGVGVIAAVSVPSLMDMRNNYNTVFAAQEISTHLHFAKLKAVSGNEAVRVNFGNDDFYQVEYADGTRLQGPFPYPSGIRLNYEDAGDAVTFPGKFVTFQADGTVPIVGNGSIGRVKLISPDGLRVDVLVERGGIIRQTSPYRITASE